MAKIDTKINELKDKHLIELMTPCSVFMTFENEEGVNRALEYGKAIEKDDSLDHLKIWLGCYELEI